MPQVCFYFQLHQPYRLEPFSIFDLDEKKSFFDKDQDLNKEVFKKVSQKSYLPMLSLLLDLVQRHPEFKFALSASGVFLQQALEFEPKVIKLLQKLSRSGQVEFLAETYHHSLSSLYSGEEFRAQVSAHQKIIEELFAQTPTSFRNTELIYSNQIGQMVAEMGFAGMLTEAVDRYLGNRAKTQVFASYTQNQIPLLLKHAQLSDDIAFRFSDKNWAMHPLHADQYFTWLKDYCAEEIINLFMDFETFGEHQWSDTGIFQFFEDLIYRLNEDRYSDFVTPGEVFDKYQTKQQLEKLPVYDVPEPISWADVDRDLTAWNGNDLQKDTLRLIYSMSEDVLDSKDTQLIETWRKLQTSDHFYYMCTKWSADGDVHAYFSPYDDPYEAYNRYCAVVVEFAGKIKAKN